MNRRSFLQTLAAGLAVSGSTLSGQVFETDSASAAVPVSAANPAPIPVETDEEGLTPLRRFFAVAIVSFPPKIDTDTEKLELEGAVASPYSLGYDELRQWPRHEQKSLLKCVGGASGRAKWSGVRLRDLLEKGQMDPDALEIIFHGADGYHSSIPLAVAMKSDSMLALHMNDEPLWPKHGSPVRLVLPGMYGYKQVKWLTRIEVTTTDHKGYWEQRGYSDDGRIKS